MRRFMITWCDGDEYFIDDVTATDGLHILADHDEIMEAMMRHCENIIKNRPAPFREGLEPQISSVIEVLPGVDYDKKGCASYAEQSMNFVMLLKHN